MSLQLVGNKGEWSEVYVLLKILSEGKLCSKVASEYSEYDIIQVIRNELKGECSYKIKESTAEVYRNNRLSNSIERSKIGKIALHLFGEIKKLTNKTEITDPRVCSLLEELNCHQLKATSLDKSDIHVVVYDHHTGLTPKLGFSIKSKLGGDSTILNPGGTTMFSYVIKGDLNDELLGKLESLHHFNKAGKKSYEVRDVVKMLIDNRAELVFEKMKHPIASANFMKIDSRLPEIMALALLEWFSGGEKKIPPVCDTIEHANPLGFPCDVLQEMYHYKVKKLLAEVALGMVPGTPWSGKYDATGGFIIIEKNGDVVCYHLIDRNILEDYLFQNTYLDTPSSAKFSSYGGVYCENGDYKIDLCLQIRFNDKLKI